mgnify:CR=1 FL=1
MNLYNEINEEQRNLLSEAGIKLENKDYTKDEIIALENSITGYIFSKSKKEIGETTNKYMKILQFMEKLK